MKTKSHEVKIKSYELKGVDTRTNECFSFGKYDTKHDAETHKSINDFCIDHHEFYIEERTFNMIGNEIL